MLAVTLMKTYCDEEQQPAKPAAPPQASALPREQHCSVEEASGSGPVMKTHLAVRLVCDVGNSELFKKIV